MGLRLHTPAAGLRLTCIDTHAARPWESEVEGLPAASLCVLLDGCMDTALRGARALRIGSGMCAFMQSSERSAGFNHMHAGRRFRLVGIHLVPEMAQALPADLRSAWQPPLATAHASAALLRAARDLFTCPLPEGPARRLWLHAKALEALALFAHQSARQSSQLRPANARAGSPHAADLPRLRRAHALLQQHCEQPWTAAELARLTGLNEKRLQAGFQHLYGLRTCSRSRHGRAGCGFGRSAALRSLPMARAIGGAARLATHPKSHPIRLAPKS